tara:strand:+ start:381 stop:605 length:225 start_codon:yes stop_codon:yes gene_type:complete
MTSLKISLWISVALTIVSLVLGLKDIYIFGFFTISIIYFVGIEIVKNIHRSTATHMKHNGRLLKIMIDALKVDK